MDALSAEAVVDLFEKDARARRRLAELLVSEPDTRLAIINAVLRDVATKDDIDRLRSELRSEFRSEMEKLEKSLRSEIDKLWAEIKEARSEISELEGRIDGLETRIARLEGQMGLFIKLFIAFNVPTLVGIIGILLRLIAR